MQDQHRNIHLLQVLGEVGLGEGFDAIIGALEPTQHALQPPALYHTLAHLGAVPIEPEERTAGDVEEELRPIFQHGGSKAVKDVYRKSGGIGRRLDHKWWDGADEDGLGHPAGSVASNEPGHLTTAG